MLQSLFCANRTLRTCISSPCTFAVDLYEWLPTLMVARLGFLCFRSDAHFVRARVAGGLRKRKKIFPALAGALALWWRMYNRFRD